jgi:hypothetical protein
MPDMVARQNGEDGTADVLKEWLEDNDMNLREHEGDMSASAGGKASCIVGALDSLESIVRKRLHVRQPINHALDSACSFQ